MKYNVLGDTNHAGYVRLSDVYTSAVGSAKDGIAASQRALYDAYNSITTSLINKVYPVGSIYLSVNNVSPATFIGGTWTALSNGYILKLITSGTGGTETATGNTGQASGNTGSHTLTAKESGCPTHGHGNNLAFTTPKFTHSITQPAFSATNGGGGATTGMSANKTHTHTFVTYKAGSAGNGTGTVYTTYMNIAGTQSNTTDACASIDHTHNIPNHSHTVTRTTNVGVGDHAATACTKSGGVSDRTGTDASSGHTHSLNSHTHSAGMPANISVYGWKRTA